MRCSAPATSSNREGAQDKQQFLEKKVNFELSESPNTLNFGNFSIFSCKSDYFWSTMSFNFSKNQIDDQISLQKFSPKATQNLSRESEGVPPNSTVDFQELFKKVERLPVIQKTSKKAKNGDFGRSPEKTINIKRQHQEANFGSSKTVCLVSRPTTASKSSNLLKLPFLVSERILRNPYQISDFRSNEISISGVDHLEDISNSIIAFQKIKNKHFFYFEEGCTKISLLRFKRFKEPQKTLKAGSLSSAATQPIGKGPKSPSKKNQSKIDFSRPNPKKGQPEPFRKPNTPLVNWKIGQLNFNQFPGRKIEQILYNSNNNSFLCYVPGNERTILRDLKALKKEIIENQRQPLKEQKHLIGGNSKLVTTESRCFSNSPNKSICSPGMLSESSDSINLAGGEDSFNLFVVKENQFLPVIIRNGDTQSMSFNKRGLLIRQGGDLTFLQDSESSFYLLSKIDESGCFEGIWFVESIPNIDSLADVTILNNSTVIVLSRNGYLSIFKKCKKRSDFGKNKENEPSGHQKKAPDSSGGGVNAVNCLKKIWKMCYQISLRSCRKSSHFNLAIDPNSKFLAVVHQSFEQMVGAKLSISVCKIQPSCLRADPFRISNQSLVEMRVLNLGKIHTKITPKKAQKLQIFTFFQNPKF